MTTLLITDAISVLMSAADVRAEQWAGVANDADRSELIDELYEADADEGARMCDIIEEAMITVQNSKRCNEYPTYTTDQALTAMIIQEWFAGRDNNSFCPNHYKENCGASTLRARFLFCADAVNQAWEYANKELGYDDCFDWEFVPDYMEWAAQLDIQPQDFAANQAEILEAMGIKPITAETGS